LAKSAVSRLRLLHRITRFGYALDGMAAGVGADLQAYSEN
jgi:hypothetical protein